MLAVRHLHEDSGELNLTFCGSAKTSDFIVDSLCSWWDQLPVEKRSGFSLLQIKVDNGPESDSRRTQFLKRMVAFADPLTAVIATAHALINSGRFPGCLVRAVAKFAHALALRLSPSQSNTHRTKRTSASQALF